MREVKMLKYVILAIVTMFADSAFADSENSPLLKSYTNAASTNVCKVDVGTAAEWSVLLSNLNCTKDLMFPRDDFYYVINITNDIDFGISNSEICSGMTPSPSLYTSFTSGKLFVFGNGKKLSGICMGQSLFGTPNDLYVRDLTIENTKVYSTYSISATTTLGVLAISVSGSMEVYNTKMSDVSVVSNGYKSGLFAASVGKDFIAENDTIKNGVVSNTSTTEAYVGGLVGSINEKTTVKNSVIGVSISVNNITQSSYVGGAIGVIDSAKAVAELENVTVDVSDLSVTLPQTYSSVATSGFAISLGGIVGRFYNGTASLKNCNSLGAIKVESTSATGFLKIERSLNVGGLVGYAPQASDLSISESKSSIDVSLANVRTASTYTTSKTFEVFDGTSAIGGLVGCVKPKDAKAKVSIGESVFDGSISIASPFICDLAVGGILGRATSESDAALVDLNNVETDEDAKIDVSIFSGFVGGIVGNVKTWSLNATDAYVNSNVKATIDDKDWVYSYLKMGGAFGILVNSSVNLKRIYVSGDVDGSSAGVSVESQFYSAFGGIVGSVVNANSVKSNVFEADSLRFKGSVKASNFAAKMFVGGLVGLDMNIADLIIRNSAAVGETANLIDVSQNEISKSRIVVGGVVGSTLGYPYQSLSSAKSPAGNVTIEETFAKGGMKLSSTAKKLDKINGSAFVAGIFGYAEYVNANNLQNVYYNGGIDLSDYDVSFGESGENPNFINVRGVGTFQQSNAEIINAYIFANGDANISETYNSIPSGTLTISGKNAFVVKSADANVKVDGVSMKLASARAAYALNKSESNGDVWYFDELSNDGMPLLMKSPVTADVKQVPYKVTFYEGETTVFEGYTNVNGLLTYGNDGSVLAEDTIPGVYSIDYENKKVYAWGNSTASSKWDGSKVLTADADFYASESDLPELVFADESGMAVADGYKYWTGSSYDVSATEDLPVWYHSFDGAYYKQNGWSIGENLFTTRTQAMEYIVENEITSPVTLSMFDNEKSRVKSSVTFKLENLNSVSLDIRVQGDLYSETLKSEVVVLPRMDEFTITSVEQSKVTLIDSLLVVIGKTSRKVSALSKSSFSMPTGVDEVTITFLVPDTANVDTAVVDTAVTDTAFAPDTSKNDSSVVSDTTGKQDSTVAPDTSVSDKPVVNDTLPKDPEVLPDTDQKIDSVPEINVPAEDSTPVVVEKDVRECNAESDLKNVSVEIAGTAAQFAFDISIPESCDKLEPKAFIVDEIGNAILDTVLPSVANKYAFVKYPLNPGKYTFMVNLTEKKKSSVTKAVASGFMVKHNTWTMISVGALDKSNVDISSAYMYKWDAGIDQGEYLQYVRFNDMDESVDTEGYWIYSAKSMEVKWNLPLKKAEGKEVSWNVSYNHNGWNLLANPYSWNLYVGSAKNFRSAENSELPFWRWNAVTQSYHVCDTLYANEAFWYETDKSRTISVSSAPVFKTSLEKKNAQVALMKAQTKKSWSMSLLATDEDGASDIWNVFGVGSKNIVVSEPPSSMNSGLSVSFKDENGKALAKRIIANDEPESEGYVWAISIKASSSQKVNLKLDGLDEVRTLGFRAALEIDGKVVEWNDKSTITVNASSTPKTALLKVVPQQVEVVASKGIDNLNFNANAGRIAVQFSVNADVAGKTALVRVVDLKGGVVASTKSQVSSGTNLLDVKSPEKSGVYILQVKVGSHSKAIRMAL